MFWGLSMEPQKRYTQQVAESFHISQAAIDVNRLTQETSPTQIVLEFESCDYVLATLSKSAKIYQAQLDLNFAKGDHVSFRTVGPGTVYLSGYHVIEDDDLESRLMAGDDSDEEDEVEEEEDSIIDESIAIPPGKRKKLAEAANKQKGKFQADDDEDSDDDDSFGSTLLDLEPEESDEDEDDGEEEEDENGDEASDDDESEEEEEPVVSAKKPKLDKNASVNGVATPGKKDKLNNSKKDVATPKSGAKTGKPNLNQSKQEKTPKQEAKTPKEDKKTPKSPSSPAKKVLEGGVVAEELKVGEGPVAKPGKMAQVYYVGRLKSNNKQFDATTGGPGFKFRVGRGEVIRGWDIGVAGMRVGGKRRLTVPAGFAYGAKGSPPVIPPNATLVFEVELRGVS